MRPIGQRLQPAPGIAGQPGVQGLPGHPDLGRRLADLQIILDHRQHRLIALLGAPGTPAHPLGCTSRRGPAERGVPLTDVWVLLSVSYFAPTAGAAWVGTVHLMSHANDLTDEQ
jgi:hypothetical protein